MVNKTFVFIKPDGIRLGLIGEIISRFERKQLQIAAIETKLKDETWCQLHYSHLVGEIYKDNEEFVIMTPLVGIILRGEEAVHVVKTMVGLTNSMEAAPGTIRGDYGTLPIYYNVIHAADSEESAKHEIELFFNREI